MPRYDDRPLTADDVPAAVALHRAEHAQRYVPLVRAERLRAGLDDPDLVQRIVVDPSGAAAGFWSARVHDGWLVEIVRIIAATPGRGVGSAALASAVAFAFDERGAHRCYLEVTADNEPARALYERGGFRLEAVFREGFRDAAGSYRDLCGYGLLRGDRLFER